MDCPYRGDSLIKVLKCSEDDDQGPLISLSLGTEFHPINLKNVFDELLASVEGSVLKGNLAGRDKKDIVKKYESLQIISDKENLKKSCEDKELSSSSMQKLADNINSPQTQKVKDLVKKFEAL